MAIRLTTVTPGDAQGLKQQLQAMIHEASGEQ